MNSGMNDLVNLSREYGSDPAWVVAGGGNTSFKDDDTLYVKASGFALATIDEEGFARMDRRKLAEIWHRDYPAGDDAQAVAERERLVLEDMMDARLPGENRRPSVETQLHDLLPWPLVIHLHPTLVNGLTCGKDGMETAGELFGDAMMWVPVIDPGYVLAAAIREALKERTDRGMESPDFIFLANHGVFVGGNDAVEVREKYTRLDAALRGRIIRKPGGMPAMRNLPGDDAGRSALLSAGREFFGENAVVRFLSGGELTRYLKAGADTDALTGCLTPDHIVYSGPGALTVPADSSDSTEEIADAWLETGRDYLSFWGKPANIVLVPGAGGALVAAGNETAADNAALLLENALEVAAWSDSFGGPNILEERFIRFIVNWEVENYRSRMSTG